MAKAPISIAIANTPIDKDVPQNGALIRDTMRKSKDQGARLVHFAEGALSGYVKAQIRSWDDVDWRIVQRELNSICDLAADLELFVVLGNAHPLGSARRPRNSLVIISDQGAVMARYDKRYLSNTEISDWYSPGFDPCVFTVDGWTFGCALCIEVHFADVFAEYEQLDVDCVLVSSYSREPMDWIELQGHAAGNNLWISLATPMACNRDLPGGLIGPDGHPVGRFDAVSTDSALSVPLDHTSPAFDIPLNKARPWRRLARAGAIYRDAT